MLKDLKTTSFQSLRPNIGRCDCGLALRIMLILLSFVVAIAVLFVQQRVSSLRSQKAQNHLCSMCDSNPKGAMVQRAPGFLCLATELFEISNV